MKNGKFWDERLAERAGTVCLVLLAIAGLIGLGYLL
jgi:hypothetical protein